LTKRVSIKTKKFIKNTNEFKKRLRKEASSKTKQSFKREKRTTLMNGGQKKQTSKRKKINQKEKNN
jgi:hypothetical protein